MKKDFFISKSPTKVPLPVIEWSEEEEELPFKPAEEETWGEEGEVQEAKEHVPIKEGYEEIPEWAPQEFEKGEWLDPFDTTYGKGKCHQALFSDPHIISEDSLDAQTPETAFVILAEDEPANFKEPWSPITMLNGWKHVKPNTKLLWVIEPGT